MTTETVDLKPPRRVRWLPGVILLVLTPLWLYGAWLLTGVLADRDRTFQMVGLIAALVVAFVVQLVWWLGFARLSLRGKAVGALCVLAIAAVAAGGIRIDGFRGEMFPIFAFRWQPTPEERAIAYFESDESQATKEKPTGGASDDDPLSSPGDWPQYRGPNRTGVDPEASIRTNWTERPLEFVWGPQPIGLGWSSFAVAGDRLYTHEQRGDDEVVVCYDGKTGKQHWVHADVVRFSETLGGDGPRATPTVVDGAVYSMGATGLLNCLDAATGSPRWQRDTLKDAGGGTRVDNIEWGMAGSPEVWDGKVYVAPGGKQGKGVIAYDTAAGDVVWAGGNDEASYAAPRVETIGGVPQLLVVDGAGLKGYDAAAGDLLWSIPWTNQPKVNASQPVVVGDRVFLSSGYGVGSVLLEIVRDGEAWKANEVWRTENKFKLKFNDAVLHDGYLYGIDEGVLACIAFDTGEQQWKKGRYGYGQTVLLGETLVILAEDGTLAAVKATPEKYEELARVPVLEGKTWNHPAYARGLLYVRNDREAACIDLRP